MLYSKHITFPFGQTANTPTWFRFTVNRGVIYQVFITFPRGVNALTKVRIFHEGSPMLPSQEDEYITGNDYTFPFLVFHEILGAPEQITIMGWNEDEYFDHTIQFLFEILDRKYVMPVGSYEGIITAMKTIFYPQVVV